LGTVPYAHTKGLFRTFLLNPSIPFLQVNIPPLPLIGNDNVFELLVKPLVLSKRLDRGSMVVDLVPKNISVTFHIESRAQVAPRIHQHCDVFFYLMNEITPQAEPRLQARMNALHDVFLFLWSD
jgi:hypothetical protein